MTRFTSLAAAATLVLGSVTFLGCESDNQSDLPRDESGYTAGGNGAFGENPAQPGDYSYNNSSQNGSYSQSSGNNGGSR